jgi:hypothetical protein
VEINRYRTSLVLSGDTNIKFVLDNDCHIWNGDAYKNWFENGRNEFEKADPMVMSEDALGKKNSIKSQKSGLLKKSKQMKCSLLNGVN